MPGSRALPWLFFLLVRIFFNLGSGFSVSVAPSGMFPGGGEGARSWRFPICGGEGHGLDRVSSLSFRVLLVIFEPLVVISCFFRGLVVILYRPLD
jgi:hypothetical protein